MVETELCLVLQRRLRPTAVISLFDMGDSRKGNCVAALNSRVRGVSRGQKG